METYYNLPQYQRKLSLSKVQEIIPANAPCIFYGVKGGMITGSYATFGDFVHVVTKQSDILQKSFTLSITGTGEEYKTDELSVVVKHKTEGWSYGAFLVRATTVTSKGATIKFVKPTKSNNTFIQAVKMRPFSEVKKRIDSYKRV